MMTAVYTDTQASALYVGLSALPDSIIYSMDSTNTYVLVVSLIQSNGHEIQFAFGTGGIDGQETQTAFLAGIAAKWPTLSPINVQRFIA